MKTRIEAAKELHAIYNAMETRKVKLSTIYRRIYRIPGGWHLIGRAHDYTA